MNKDRKESKEEERDNKYKVKWGKEWKWCVKRDRRKFNWEKVKRLEDRNKY